MGNGYARAIGDSDYNFGYQDFTIEFFVETFSHIGAQTLFEITNNESSATDLYKKTRFVTLLENGNINTYALQSSWPIILSSGNNFFQLPGAEASNIKIFYNGTLLATDQYTFINGNVTLSSDVIVSGTVLVEACEILFSILGNQVSETTTHFVSVERKDSKCYLFLDGVLQGNAATALISIPDQLITNSIPPYQVLNRTNGPALLTIGANKNGENPLLGKFGDIRVTKGVARHVVTLNEQNSIYSLSTDTTLGTRAQDINIYGGGFVDSMTSHAPEERIEGQIFDTLEIDVFQNANCSYLSSNISNISAPISNIANPYFNANALLLGYRIFKDSISIGPFDSYQFTTANSFIYKVPWSTLDNDSATIQIDGISLPSASWSIKNNNLVLPSDIPANSNVVITLTGDVTYYSLGANAVSTLTANLNSTDSTISVQNTNQFITPVLAANLRGQVFINGECITYLYINRTSNILSGLMRGTSGTGIPNVHLANSQIVVASFTQQVTANPGSTSWYDSANVPLANSNSAISTFLLSQGAFIPA